MLWEVVAMKWRRKYGHQRVCFSPFLSFFYISSPVHNKAMWLYTCGQIILNAIPLYYTRIFFLWNGKLDSLWLPCNSWPRPHTEKREAIHNVRAYVRAVFLIGWKKYVVSKKRKEEQGSTCCWWHFFSFIYNFFCTHTPIPAHSDLKWILSA